MHCMMYTQQYNIQNIIIFISIYTSDGLPLKVDESRSRKSVRNSRELPFYFY